MQKCRAVLTVGVLWALSAAALERPDTTFKIFQFPADQIPRVDGDVSDWGMVPADYAIGIDQLKDTVHDSPDRYHRSRRHRARRLGQGTKPTLLPLRSL